jgi:diadenosine tetraphosphatase ApaH/serine/threonine PP2A family protein phosphatase
LRSDHITTLRQWPATITVALPGLGTVLFCHATPRSDTEIFTRVTAEERIAPAFEGIAAETVVCGHTHMAFDRRVGKVRVLNAGSVGMPFGAPGAHWLLLDTNGPRFMRTAYDLEAAAARIRATTYPGAEAFAAENVLRPPTEDAMTALFER